MNDHSITVGKIMQQLALEKTGNQDYANDMFVLGYLHDIGKQFGYKAYHAERGGEILKRSKYKYRQEVYYHGCIDMEYSSPELDLINTADMQVLQDGTRVSVTERLEDIGRRYGLDSLQYKNSLKISEKLNLL